MVVSSEFYILCPRRRTSPHYASDAAIIVASKCLAATPRPAVRSMGNGIYFTFYDCNEANVHHKLDGLGSFGGDSQFEFC